MNEKVIGKLKTQFRLMILFVFLIGINVATRYLVSHPPVWTTVGSIIVCIVFCVIGLLIHLDLKKQEQFTMIGQIVDVKKKFIIVKGLGRGNTRIAIKDMDILNMMHTN